MGEKTERFTLRAAVYLILRKGRKVLLARRYKTGWMDGKYSLVAGHLEGNESVSNAMLREAKEEAGIIIAPEELKPATVVHRRSLDQEYMDFFFTCKKWLGKPKIMEPNKCDYMDWFLIDELPSNTLLYIKDAIDNSEKGIPFSEDGWN
jgi:8-oxo-dGTP diphosphatase